MRAVVTYSGRSLEFLELDSRVLHLRPRGSLELTEEELEEVRDRYPDVFANMFVHDLTENQKKRMKKESPKVEVKPVESVRKPGRPKATVEKQKSDSDKS